uniref:Uncharacterized protein n=1 Tax=uncultured Thiotrichaceae bacterium TaxID=298394 RepID=A0A6S6UDP7_9GAMM|nr:MAG: Unknown protein [uncultured Thiotrichaceae bacterium]
MKKLTVISIVLFTLSGSLVAQDATDTSNTQTSETAPVLSIDMVKEAFKFGFQSGWMKQGNSAD